MMGACFHEVLSYVFLRYGRRNGCILWALLSLANCLLMHSKEIRVLILGRVIAGTCLLVTRMILRPCHVGRMVVSLVLPLYPFTPTLFVIFLRPTATYSMCHPCARAYKYES